MRLQLFFKKNCATFNTDGSPYSGIVRIRRSVTEFVYPRSLGRVLAIRHMGRRFQAASRDRNAA